ncbi:MAG: 2-succinyl-5-enolpyruvyl-6-hydroxy-3-cyclohexene-1-carboxylic-acid synthase [Bacteroidetes bacterium]|nr:MAG: 2-succinyl-5-enolpyruvyl-6-hydroxy-3-cyclohexene-1-carboxylic-acid synthase [Bacteroidota bacterium]
MQEAINHIAAACAAADVRYAIICPGSRNAPLTMAFARHPGIKCQSVIDERSAGFIALGMAQRCSLPIVVICTSGSAVVNLYPAVVEAYYQRLQLIVITADRPPEMIDQWDGQTMHQHEVFGKHVKASYTLPDRYDNPEEFSATVFEAVKLSLTGNRGPVHINVPLREPLYTAINDTFEYPQLAQLTSDFYFGNKGEASDISELKNAINQYQKILVVIGTQKHTEMGLLIAYQKVKDKIPFVCDVLSNQLNSSRALYHSDMLLSIPNPQLKAQLQPEVLLTFGTSVVSKNLKQFLRQYKPKKHFHISRFGETADPFDTSPIQIIGSDRDVFEQLDFSHLTTDYNNLWQKHDDQIASFTEEFLSQPTFHELAVADRILKHLPDKSQLQLANSMAVRWVNILGGNKYSNIAICGNRGVSGIDGCTSTAVGMAYMDDEAMNHWGVVLGANTVTLLTGDVAFFYDSNALWNKFAPANLRIIILNNGGGAIFRLIDGPGQMPEREEFLETRHQRTAKLLCEDMKVGYAQASNFEELERELELLYQASDRPKVLEVFTDAETNTKFFNEYKQLIHGLE